MDLFHSENLIDGCIVLGDEESHHLIKVLRRKSGDVVFVTDGKGVLYTTEVSDTNSKKCTLKIVKKQEFPDKKNYRLHIAIAPTKNSDRLEWFLEKATEIGIDEITPLICKHSERKIVKEERLNKVLIAAMKQSLHFVLPILKPTESFSNFLKITRAPQRYICSMEATEFLSERYKTDEDTVILIGPEGDFSKEELREAIEHGFVPVSLGNSRLRTETAGIMACATIAVIHNKK
ncbi:MAG: 16S rRNA (uracil(1498)-N(3))-methyltransferase [Bacteroidia bacterium]|nr:16S rRNA (uracil(1498)-N(3))-methyltransferase [Bacteroidia bacterium]